MLFLTKRNNGLLVDKMINDFFDRPFGVSSPWFGSFVEDWSHNQPIRTKKNENGSLELEFDVPGLDKKDIDLQYDAGSGVLSVSSKTPEAANTTALKRSFEYKTSLFDIDPDTIEAKCEKGVLSVTVRSLQKQPTKKQIEIK